MYTYTLSKFSFEGASIGLVITNKEFFDATLFNITHNVLSVQKVSARVNEMK